MSTQSWSAMAQRRREVVGVDRSLDKNFQQLIEVRVEAEELIGHRAWTLLSRYGRMIGGQHTGLYVSGVPFAVQLDLVHRLSRGETVSVHLMHRHVSGRPEPSALRWSQSGGLVMVFENRDEKA
jgi:hypothetical protein